MKERSVIRSSLRAHLISAGWGALCMLLTYSVALLSYGIAEYCVPSNGNHLPKLIAPLSVIALGLITVIVLSFVVPRGVTFLGVAFCTHVIMSFVFLAGGGLLLDLAQHMKGEVPPPPEELSPDGDLSSIYIVINWIMIVAFAGPFLLLYWVVYTVVDACRRIIRRIVAKVKNRRSAD